MKQNDDNTVTPYTRFRNRLSVWRRTMVLFHKYRRLDGVFEGPFRKAGYDTYIIEHHISAKPGSGIKSDLTPDIIAWNYDQGKAVVVDITTNPLNHDEKVTQLVKYRDKMNIADIRTFGGPINAKYDVLLSHQDYYEKDIPFCDLVVGKPGEPGLVQVKNLDRLSDDVLSASLKDFQLNQLSDHVPEIGIALLPEMEGPEIRVALSAIILSLFKPGSDGAMSAEEFTRLGLERLYDRVTPYEFNDLVKKVVAELNSLMEYVDKYLEYNGKTEKYSVTKKGKSVSTNYNSKKAFMYRLNEWIINGEKSSCPDSGAQRMLGEFFDDLDEVDAVLDNL